MSLDTTNRRVNQPVKLSLELSLIPRWSVALAMLAFVGVQYLFWFVLPEHRHHPGPPLGVRVYFALSWSALAAVYMLMIGYVSKDAPRRFMNARFWMLVCVLMPGGVGAVLYFLLRQPVVSSCPACGTPVQSDFHFCPQCACQLAAACGNCYRTARPTDMFCVHCGHEMAADNMPARMRSAHS